MIRNYTRIPFKKGSLDLHMILYHLQYENRDFNIKIVDNPTAKKEKLIVENILKNLILIYVKIFLIVMFHQI